jgi:hypothetical protein
MDYGRMMIFATREVWMDSIALRVGLKMGDDRLAVAMPINWQTVPQGERAPEEPLLRLQRDDAQRLMDELWNVGLRPSEGSGSAGQLAAVQNHLEDMRTIAMSQLGIA